MVRPERPVNEAARLAAIERYEILDTEPEALYDDLLAIAAGICDTPMGSVSIVADDRQWFKARRGIAAQETSRDVAFCAHAILTPEDLMVVSDAKDDARFHDNPLVTGAPHIRFYAGAPLLSIDGEATGTLCVMDSKPRLLSAFQRESMVSLSRQVSQLLELRAAYRELRHHLREREWYEQQLVAYGRELEERNAELHALSRTDPLTGLHNRRAFNAALAAAIAKSVQDGSALAVAIVDVDHFKMINDLHGHPVGDETLVAIARAIGAQLGKTGFAARCGGEEFGLILSSIPLDHAELQCEFLRQAVENLSTGLPITVSIGLTGFRAGDSAETMYERADGALYAAKRAGRNRVETA